MGEQSSDAGDGHVPHSRSESNRSNARESLLDSEVFNQRIGLRLFALYSVFYGGFVFVNAFAADWSDWEPIEGLNLAVLWGFALILLALLLAMIYGAVCRTDTSNTGTQGTIESETEA